MGKLYVIGIGPGGIEHMTVRAQEAIAESNIVVGYVKYIEMIKELIKDKEVYSNGMMGEEARCAEALRLSKDNVVSVVSTGDSGIYGMAGLILELADKEDLDNIEVIPGVTASSAAASIVGAPLMHDNCNISLSDLMTPYELIKRRVEAAASSDFIISLYNPKSKGRPHYLRESLEIIKKYRHEDTPIAVVRHALREGQEQTLFTIADFDDSIVDMFSIVIVGNSQTYIKEGKMITPRGYKVNK
jgi:precorrin-3B C17-methyltransferase